MNFRDILEEKMATERNEAPSRPSTETAYADPAHLAFLLGNVRVRRFQAPPKGPAQPEARPKARPAPLRPARPKGPPHALSERQKAAMAWFKEQGVPLEDDFTASELKTAFRTAARRTHPDAGGSAEGFLALKRHHASLKAIFP